MHYKQIILTFNLEIVLGMMLALWIGQIVIVNCNDGIHTDFRFHSPSPSQIQSLTHEINRFLSVFRIFYSPLARINHDNSHINLPERFWIKTRKKKKWQTINPPGPTVREKRPTHEKCSIRDIISYYKSLCFTWNELEHCHNIEIALKIHIFGNDSDGGNNDSQQRNNRQTDFSLFFIWADSGFISLRNFVWLRHTAASVIIIRQ